MRVLRNIGDIDDPNYTPLEKILECDDVIAFDGVYRSVYEHRDKLSGKKIIMFIIGGFVGRDNSILDPDRLLEQYCTWKELEELANVYGWDIGWHTHNHYDLTTLDDKQLAFELTTPFRMTTMAYPYGKFDERVIDAVNKAGFTKAYSVEQGDNTEYQITRKYL